MSPWRIQTWLNSENLVLRAPQTSRGASPAGAAPPADRADGHAARRPPVAIDSNHHVAGRIGRLEHLRPERGVHSHGDHQPAERRAPTGGMVTFMDGSTTLGTETLTSGTCSFQTTDLDAGPNLVSAVYSGTAAFQGSSTPAGVAGIITTVAGGGFGDGGPATAPRSMSCRASPLTATTCSSPTRITAVIREVNQPPA